MSDYEISIVCIIYGLFMGKVLILITDFVISKELKTFYSLAIILSALALMCYVGLMILIII